MDETSEVGNLNPSYPNMGVMVAFSPYSLSFLFNFVFETELLCVVVAFLEHTL